MSTENNHYWITGIVIRGDGRGRSIGFPTANLEPDKGLDPPPPGIYAAWAKLEEHCFMAALHIGPRPTFKNTAATIELHLLDFPDRDLYGTSISFSIVQKLRDGEKFDSIEALREAIKQDIAHAREILRKPKE